MNIKDHETLAKKSDFMKIWKPQTLISSILPIKILMFRHIRREPIISSSIVNSQFLCLCIFWKVILTFKSKIYISCIVDVSFGKSYILNNILLTIHLFNTIIKKNDFTKIWKPLTLISSIMVIKNFAIEGCASEDAHNARLELATSTYSHLHLKSRAYFSILRRLIIIFIFMYWKK